MDTESSKELAFCRHIIHSCDVRLEARHCRRSRRHPVEDEHPAYGQCLYFMAVASFGCEGCVKKIHYRKSTNPVRNELDGEDRMKRWLIAFLLATRRWRASTSKPYRDLSRSRSATVHPRRLRHSAGHPLQPPARAAIGKFTRDPVPITSSAAARTMALWSHVERRKAPAYRAQPVRHNPQHVGKL
jgi:hypothetical protein